MNKICCLLCCLAAAVLPAWALQVSPNPARLGPGESVSFSAQGADLGADISWEVIPAGLGKIDSRGFFTAGRPGQGIVRAVAKARDGRTTLSHALIKIESGRPSRLKVEVTPPRTELRRGERIRFSCLVQTPEGSPVDSPVVLWQVVPARLGNIDIDGNFTPLMPGQGRVVARAEGPNAKGLGQSEILVLEEGQQLEVELLPSRVRLKPGASAQISAQVRDASGQPVRAAVRYSLSPSTLGVIDDQGNFTAGSETGPGLVKALATAGSRQGIGRALVVIEPTRRQYSVMIKPRQATVETGSSLELEAEVRDQDGKPAGQAMLDWKLIPEEIGTITPQGVFTAGERPGYGRIVASLAGDFGRGQDAATVRIVSRSRNEIRISPSKSGLRPGQMVQFSARISNARSRQLEDARVRWTVSPPGLGTITQSGLFTAGPSAGSGMVVAEIPSEMGGGRAAAPVTISNYQLKLNTPPNQYNIHSGELVQFAATLRDANGNDLSASAEFEWEVRTSIQNFGNIDRSTGLFRAGQPAKLPAEGYVTVRARLNGLPAGADGIKIMLR
jgi:hypothetical protein